MDLARGFSEFNWIGKTEKWSQGSISAVPNLLCALDLHPGSPAKTDEITREIEGLEGFFQFEGLVLNRCASLRLCPWKKFYQ